VLKYGAFKTFLEISKLLKNWMQKSCKLDKSPIFPLLRSFQILHPKILLPAKFWPRRSSPVAQGAEWGISDDGLDLFFFFNTQLSPKFSEQLLDHGPDLGGFMPYVYILQSTRNPDRISPTD